MRRIRQRQPRSLFRGAELPRLATLVVMLGVLALLIGRAREPGTWRWLAPEASPSVQNAAVIQRDVVAPRTAVEDEAELEPLEHEAALEEFQAITDKAPLGKVEMPAYWRLMAWQERQSIETLRSRARQDVTFRELWQQPDRWRGQLVELSLHLRQTACVDRVEDNALAITSLHEVWGWNTDSQPYCFWLVCPQLPPGMPEGKNIFEEATFVGYFLKLIPYEDHEGKKLATPLLIGQLIWHPGVDAASTRSEEWTWTTFAMIALAAVLIVRFGLALTAKKTSAAGSPLAERPGEQTAVEAWLSNPIEPSSGQNVSHLRATDEMDLTGPQTFDGG